MATDQLRLSAAQARRVAVRAQLLSGPRPADLLETVRHLTFVQVEPTAAVAPSAEVVAWSRLGAAYAVGDLEAATEAGDLVELDSRLRPAEDLALHTAEMAAWPGPDPSPWQRDVAGWVEANDDCRRDILERLEDEGPQTSRSLPDTTLVPWRSSGWNDDRNVRRLLDQMAARGEVAVAGHAGRDKLWDLAARVYPDVEPVPYAEALRRRAERRLRALGLARARAAVTPGEPNDVGSIGLEVVVEGVRGRWRLDPAYAPAVEEDGEPRTVLLSPLDRLVFDRRRMGELWGFDYQLEMYKKASQRRFGYWAMPVLHGDELVGKLDATAERDRGVLRIDAVHEDPVAGRPWTRALREAVDDQIDALGDWLGLVVERT